MPHQKTGSNIDIFLQRASVSVDAAKSYTLHLFVHIKIHRHHRNLPCSGSQEKHTNTGGVLTAPIPLVVGVMCIPNKSFSQSYTLKTSPPTNTEKHENFGTSWNARVLWSTDSPLQSWLSFPWWFFFSYEELSEKKLFAWERLFDVVSKKINK